MRVFKILLASVVFAVLLIGLILFLVRYFRPKPAGILIETVPAASVFIEGVRVGTTPYEATRKAGEVLIKLVPQGERPLVPFETKLNLGPGIKTVIKREFGETEETSSGEIISFEKGAAGETSLAVVSIPDSAQLAIDGTVRGFSPYKTTNLTVGEHQLAISAQGYLDKTLMVKTLSGYKLTAFVKLAPAPLQEEQPKMEEKKTFIEILSTPTGFLRVRENPGTTGREVAQVKPGQKFPLLEEDTQTGWFKIEYLPASAGEPGKTGWITNQYAKKVEETVTSSPTPSPTASPSSSSKQS